jgi:hypothetical protein
VNSITVLVIVVVILAIVGAIAQRFIPATKKSFPFAKRKYFFSAAERSFYEILRRLVPEHVVFAKVGLSELVYVTKNGSEWRSHRNRIDRKHLDFVICNADLEPVVAIELDDSSHREQRRRDRDVFVDQVLATAGIPIVHVAAQRGYRLNELRQLLLRHLNP